MDITRYCIQCYGVLPHDIVCHYCPHCGSATNGGGFTAEQVEKAKKLSADLAELLGAMKRDPYGPPQHFTQNPWYHPCNLVLS